MLRNMAPLCLSTAADERHQYQVAVGELVQQAMGKAEASVSSAIKDAEEQAAQAQAKLMRLKAETDGRRQRLADERKKLDDAKEAWCEVHEVMRSNWRTLVEAREVRRRLDANLFEALDKKESLEAGIKSHYREIVDGQEIGPNVTALVQVCSRAGMDTGLVNSFDLVARKRPEARTSFEKIVLNELHQAASVRTAELTAIADAGNPGSEERAAVEAQAEVALVASERRMTEAARHLRRIELNVQIAESDVLDAEDAEEGADQDKRRLAMDQVIAEWSFEQFQQGPLEAFQKLHKGSTSTTALTEELSVDSTCRQQSPETVVAPAQTFECEELSVERQHCSEAASEPAAGQSDLKVPAVDVVPVSTFNSSSSCNAELPGRLAERLFEVARDQKEAEEKKEVSKEAVAGPVSKEAVAEPAASASEDRQQKSSKLQLHYDASCSKLQLHYDAEPVDDIADKTGDKGEVEKEVAQDQKDDEEEKKHDISRESVEESAVAQIGGKLECEAEPEEDEASKEIVENSGDMHPDDKLQKDAADEVVYKPEKEDEVLQLEQEKIDAVVEEPAEEATAAATEGKSECEAEPMEVDEEEVSQEVAVQPDDLHPDDQLHQDSADEGGDKSEMEEEEVQVEQEKNEVQEAAEEPAEEAAALATEGKPECEAEPMEVDDETASQEVAADDSPSDDKLDDDVAKEVGDKLEKEAEVMQEEQELDEESNLVAAEGKPESEAEPVEEKQEEKQEASNEAADDLSNLSSDDKLAEDAGDKREVENELVQAQEEEKDDISNEPGENSEASAIDIQPQCEIEHAEQDDEQEEIEVAEKADDLPSDDKLEDDAADDAGGKLEKEDEGMEEEQEEKDVVVEESVVEAAAETTEDKLECEAELV